MVATCYTPRPSGGSQIYSATVARAKVLAIHGIKRHPESAGAPQRLEDLMRQASPLGTSARLQLDRAFDDLFRQFFVAFSRAQDILLLVGVRPTFPGGQVSNIATGWDRQEVCHWSGNNLPFIEI